MAATNCYRGLLRQAGIVTVNSGFGSLVQSDVI